MRRAAVVSPIRTPIGAFGGALRPLTADQLAVHLIRSLLERTGVDGARIDEVIVSQSYASSEAPCLGRYAALAAGLPIEVPGFTLDRRCGSGLQAVIDASIMVQTGAADLVMVAGVESMSNIEYYSRGLEPAAYLVGWASAGCHPATMGIGPVPAVRKLFEKTRYRSTKLTSWN